MVTARTNRPSLDGARQLPTAEAIQLPAAHLALLQEDADAAIAAAKHAKDWLDGIIAARYGERAVALRADQRKDTGAVRFEDGAVTIAAELPKRVEWDQAGLAAVVARIRAAGDDPAEYVEVSYKVQERAYTAWHEHIRSAFMPARTVRTGKPTFKLTLNAVQGGI